MTETKQLSIFSIFCDDQTCVIDAGNEILI